MIESIILVCTPYIPLYDVNLNLEEATGILAKLIELIINIYCIEPVVSDNDPFNIIVNVLLLDIIHVLIILILFP